MQGNHSDRDLLMAEYDQLFHEASSLTRRTSMSSTFTRSDSSESQMHLYAQHQFLRSESTSPTRQRHHNRRLSYSHAPVIPALQKITTWPASDIDFQSTAYLTPRSADTTRRSSFGEEDECLHETTQAMKIVLIDLLNCEGVKHNLAWRTWVQSRLMDAETDLRNYRRRRSSLAIDERTINGIAAQLHGPDTGPVKRKSF